MVCIYALLWHELRLCILYPLSSLLGAIHSGNIVTFVLFVTREFNDMVGRLRATLSRSCSAVWLSFGT